MKKNKTLWVIVLVGALALYLFWDDLFPADTQDTPTEEEPPRVALSDTVKAMSENVQRVSMAEKLLEDKIVL